MAPALVAMFFCVALFVSCSNEVEIPSQVQTTSLSAKLYGKLDLPANGKVSGSDVWVKVVCEGETQYIGRADSDGSFSVSGLREEKSYDILFSTIKPETANERDIARAGETSGYGGWLSNVTAAVNDGNNVGSVSIKPLGTIKGRAKLDGETEHFDILVYIPGTSFSAYTNADGSFFLYNVPEGTYQLRFTYLKSGFGSEMSENVTVRGSKTNEEEHPVVEIDDKILYRDLGSIQGKILLDTEEDPTGIIVMVKNDAGTVTYTSSTDSTGAFILSDVKPGSYTLYASKPGFDSAVLEKVVVTPAAEKRIANQTLSSGVRYVSGRIVFEGRTDHSGALITATNTKDTSLIYSAISNSEGDYSLVSMLPGQYRIVVSATNYNTATIGVVSVLGDTTVDLDSTEITILRGTITGVTVLEGWTKSDGILVELMKGTEVYASTYTDDTGMYAFQVPQGNYSAVRFSREDFQTLTVPQSIALIANNFVTVGEADTAIVLQATHFSIEGNVIVKNVDIAEGVTVSIDNEPEFGTITTDSTGYFRFDHLPIEATYSIRFHKEFCADVVVPVEGIAKEVVEVKNVTLLPDSAGVEGYVYLDGMSNHSGVSVEVDTADGTRKAITDVNGYYYVGGLSVNSDYTLSVHKDGWRPAEIKVTGLVALEVSQNESVTLIDNIAPEVKKLTINGGSNATGSGNVLIKLEVTEKGSGVRYMRYSWNDGAMGSWTYYSSAFRCDLPDTVNGDYKFSIELMDNSGNTTAEKSSATITLVGNIKAVNGVLTGEDLHWRKEQNPIVVTGDIAIQSGNELVIDPGVDVLFDGNYSIKILNGGILTAVGTEDDPIVFRSVKDYMETDYSVEGFLAYDGKWNGISNVDTNELQIGIAGYDCSFQSGSIMSNCIVYDIDQGISGQIFVDKCSITSDGEYALNNFKGCLINSEVVGSVRINYPRFVFNDRFVSYNRTEYPSNASFDSWGGYYYWWDANGSRHVVYPKSTFYYYSWSSNVFANCDISGYFSVELNGESVEYTTIYDCEKLYHNCRSMKYNELHSVSNTIETSYGMQFSNFIGPFSGEYVIKASSNNSTIDYSNNYWGDYTSELMAYAKDSIGDVSFIYDSFDDFNLSSVSMNGYVSEPWSFAGYQGDGFIAMTASYNEDEVKRGSDVTVTVSSITDNQIDEYRVSQSVDELLESDYSILTGNSFIVPYSSFDPDMLDSSGYLTFYVQGRSGDVETSICTVRVPYDCPRITNMTMASGIEYKNDTAGTFTFNISDAQTSRDYYMQLIRMYIDDVYANDFYAYCWDNHQFSINPTQYTNGEHKVRIEIIDRAGNESKTEIPFTVNRPIPGVKSLSFGNNGTVAENGNLTISLSVENAKHLKEVRFYSDGLILTATGYSDDNANSLEGSFTIDGHYLKAGSHNLVVELEDYSGNVTTSSEYGYMVEGSASEGPVISSISLKDNDTVGNSATVSVSASAVKGVRAVYVSVGDKQIGSNDGRYLTYSSDYDSRVVATTLDFTGVKDGKNELTFTVVDFAGNETTAARTVNVAKTYPNVNTTVYDKQQTFYVSTTITDVSLLESVKVYAGEELVETYDVSKTGGNFVRELTKSKSEYADGTYEIKVVLVNKLSENLTVNSGAKVVIDNTKEFVENNLAGVTTFSGMLSDDERLHWTEEMSPVVITGDVTVASGKTLVIDPGVKVYVDGNYSISVRGLLDAQGTAEKPIAFRSSGNLIENHEGYYGNWGGISIASDSLSVSISNYTCVFNSGNIMKFCDVYDMSTGITGKLFIDSCTLSSSSYSLGNSSSRFRGIVINSTVYGLVRFEHNQMVFNNVFDGTGLQKTSDYGFYYYTYYNYKIVNNLIIGYDSVYIRIDNSQFEFNTIENVGRLQFENCYDGMRYNTVSNVGSQISFGSNVYGMKFSNITGLSGSPQIKVNTKWNERESHDFTNNYWGAANTTELDRASRSAAKNASFIFDGYDNADYSVIDWNGYVTEPWSFAGYQGDGFIAMTASYNENEVKRGSDVTVKVNSLADNQIDEYRVSQSVDGLLESDYSILIGNSFAVPYSSFDADMLDSSGYLTFYVQGRSDDAETSICTVRVPYDCPRITNMTMVSGTEYRNDTVGTYTFNISDAQTSRDGSMQSVALYVDDVKIRNLDTWHSNDHQFSINPAQYRNGEHKVRIEIQDRAGNESRTEIPFTVNRPVPSVKSLSFGNNGTVAENGNLTISLSVENAKHLKEVRFYSDGLILTATGYSDDNANSLEGSFTIDGHYLKAGSHNLVVELEDYSGNVTTSSEYGYMVEGSASEGPVISSISLKDNDTVGNSATVSVSASAVKGVRAVYVSVGDKQIGSNDGRYLTYSSDYDSRVVATTLDFTGVKDGKNELTFTVVDFAGNETTATRTVNVAKNYPSVNMTVYNKQESIYVSTNISDVGLMKAIRIYAGEILLDSTDVEYWGGTWAKETTKSKAEMPEGEYVVSVVLENKLGETKSFVSGQTVTVGSTAFVEKNLEGVTTFSGMLADDDQLRWTEEMSPVVITGDVTVASGKTLVIDPGVKVYFDGNYSISVRGTLDAQGTDEKPIEFRSSGNLIENHEGYYGNWGGISMASDSLSVSISGYTCVFNSGNIMKFCNVYDMSTGITGKLFVDSCTLKSNNYALGSRNYYFSGVVVNSDISGYVWMNCQMVFNNTFNGSVKVKTSDYGFYLSYCTFVNNLVTGYDYVFFNTSYTFEFNTVENIGRIAFSDFPNARYNTFTDVGSQIAVGRYFSGMTFSNITGLNGSSQITVDTRWNERSSHDFTNNYWGAANTTELDRASRSATKNASFIFDGYDNTDYSVIDWNGYVSEPWSFAGYQGNGFIAMTATYNENEVKCGNDVTVNVSPLTDNQIDEFRVSQNVSELLNSDYSFLTGGSFTMPYSSFDADMLDSDGYLTFYVQGRSGDVETSICTVRVPYDCPRITNMTMASGIAYKSDTVGTYTFNVSDAQTSRDNYMQSIRMYIDDVLTNDFNTYYRNDHQFSINPAKYTNGEHKVRIEIIDKAGNEGKYEYQFSVDRPIPAITKLVLDGELEVEENESLSFDISISNSKHLKELRVVSDDYTMFAEQFADNGANTITAKTVTINSRYLSSGEHTLRIELEDYAGNIVRSTDYSLTVNGTTAGPVISGFDVEDNQVFSNFAVEVWNLTFEDDGGVKSVEVKVDDKTITEFYDNVYQDAYRIIPLTARFTVPSYENGEHIITITASDYAGNTTTITRDVVIDKTLPVSTISKNTYTDYEYVYVYLTDSRWMYDGCLMVDGIPLKYYFFNNMSSGGYSSYSYNLYHSDLPAGEHVIQAKFTTQGGDVIYSNELQINVEREKDTSKYGVGKTWNADGSLIAGFDTRYLWGFNDEENANYETVSNENLGTIRNTVDGIGSGAASMNYSVSGVKIPFLNSEWTLEFWMKDEYDQTDNVSIRINNLLSTSYLAHSQSANSSHWYCYPYYVTNLGDSSVYYWDVAYASRKDYSEWHHYALVSTGDRFEVYKDGVLVNYSEGNKPSPTFGTGLYINMNEKAYIDELRISATARSVDELWDYVQYVKNNNLLPE